MFLQNSLSLSLPIWALVLEIFHPIHLFTANAKEVFFIFFATFRELSLSGCGWGDVRSKVWQSAIRYLTGNLFLKVPRFVGFSWKWDERLLIPLLSSTNKTSKSTQIKARMIVKSYLQVRTRLVVDRDFGLFMDWGCRRVTNWTIHYHSDFLNVSLIMFSLNMVHYLMFSLLLSTWILLVLGFWCCLSVRLSVCLSENWNSMFK